MCVPARFAGVKVPATTWYFKTFARHMTLEGQNITVTGSGESFTVNGTAQVVCGNVKTANATVYVIDGVLVPPAK